MKFDSSTSTKRDTLKMLNKELVNKIIEASEKPLEVVHDLSQPTIKTSISLDCSKAKSELGWKPETTIDQGITKTIAWWRENIN